MLFFSKVCHYVALFQKFVDTPLNGRPFLFRIDSVHQMEASLSTLCWSINTKSMVYSLDVLRDSLNYCDSMHR
jgi:hypothetical protein